LDFTVGLDFTDGAAESLSRFGGRFGLYREFGLYRWGAESLTTRSLATLDFTDGAGMAIHRRTLDFTDHPLDFNDS
jgi:hypothetical protein